MLALPCLTFLDPKTVGDGLRVSTSPHSRVFSWWNTGFQTQIFNLRLERAMLLRPRIISGSGATSPAPGPFSSGLPGNTRPAGGKSFVPEEGARCPAHPSLNIRLSMFVF
jgi:hypothetical protein